MKKATTKLVEYADLLREIRERIRNAQTRAVLSANAELIRLYWEVGGVIDVSQKQKGWGAGVIPKLALDLKNELPEIKGFSERNIGSMIAFFREYPHPESILQQPAAKLGGRPNLQQPAALLAKASISPQAASKLPESENASFLSLLWSIPWYHHVILLSKVKNLDDRLWYMQATLQNGWSRSILELQIKSKAHQRQGKSVTNFDIAIPKPDSDLVVQALKDPYIFDFLTLEEPFHERELEFGLILCQDKNKIVAEYALRGMDKPVEAFTRLQQYLYAA